MGGPPRCDMGTETAGVTALLTMSLAGHRLEAHQELS
jgi:hypothetical protein